MGPILLVDDDADFRLMLREVLERHGYHVIGVATGDQALQTFMRQPLSLIITDIHLPAISGFELMRRLRVMCRNLPPIIAVSGYDFLTSNEARVAAEALGARTILSKPVETGTLLKTIADALTDGGEEYSWAYEEKLA